MQNLTLLLTQENFNVSLVANSTDVKTFRRGDECKINYFRKHLKRLTGLKEQVCY